MERLESERELAGRQRALHRQPALAKPPDVRLRIVLRSVDDPQLLRTATLDRWLNQSLFPLDDPLHRFDDHAFAAGLSQLSPPRDGCVLARNIRDLDCAVRRGG